jgi:nucleoside-diphosphate-sugar epimerase
MKQRILLTGIAGFIGSNLAKKLVEEGHNVFGVDDLSAGNAEYVPHGCRYAVGDFAHESIINSIKRQSYDIIIHLAAQPRVGYTVEHPYDSNEVNVSKSLKILEASKDNVKRFINMSSSAVYGQANNYPTPEFHDLKPTSPYALQKMTMEKYCEMFSILYRMDTVSIRPFNVFGPNQKGNSPYATAVSAWLWAIKEGRPLRSDGTGNQSRDMVYVDNVVDVIVRAMNHDSYAFAGEAFNAGTGISTSNNEILAWFKKEFPSCKIEYAPPRLGDVHETRANILNAKYVLGYEPIVDFYDGLELTRKWIGI